MSEPLEIGASIEIAHPFIRDVYNGPPDFVEQKTWRPGTRPEAIAPDDAEMVADALGAQIVTIVSIHKPGRFPARVFFTRRWRDPNGREFGKGKLYITTAGAFRQIINGYRHEFRLLPDEAVAA